jgi:hypothetical protein
MNRYLDAEDAIHISTQNMKLPILNLIDKLLIVIYVDVKMN